MTEIKIRNRGFLPHWEMKDGIYFITFRLVDSIPKTIMDKYFEKKESLERMLNEENGMGNSYEKRKNAELLSEFINNYLDSGYGECHLSKPEIADLVAGALRIFDGKRYKLYSWCVMPNHVHVVVKIFGESNLAAVLKSWKGYTAREANKILGRGGMFWQKEYYDHLIRNEDECHRVIAYVVENPIKANLRDWKWVWVDNNVDFQAG